MCIFLFLTQTECPVITEERQTFCYFGHMPDGTNRSPPTSDLSFSKAIIYT